VLAAAAMAAMVALAIDCLREGGLREKAASALSRTQGPNELSLIREDQLCSVTREQRGQRSRLRVTLRSDAQLNETVRRELEQRLVRVFCQPGGSGPSPSPVEVEIEYLDAQQDVLDPSHMAHFGGQLFGRHLVSVEAAGALLLAALVGAVAILIQGKQLREHGESPGHE
jgi:hypothetical protein